MSLRLLLYEPVDTLLCLPLTLLPPERCLCHRGERVFLQNVLRLVSLEPPATLCFDV